MTIVVGLQLELGKFPNLEWKCNKSAEQVEAKKKMNDMDVRDLGDLNGLIGACSSEVANIFITSFENEELRAM